MKHTNIVYPSASVPLSLLYDRLFPASHLPIDCLYEIFNYLNQTDIAGLFSPLLVNKEWNRTGVEVILKDKAEGKNWQKIAFGVQQWAFYLKAGFLKDEEVLKAFSILPKNIHDVLNQSLHAFTESGECLKDTHALIYVSNKINKTELDLKILGKLMKVNFGNYGFFNQYIKKTDNSVDEPYWMLISKKVLEGTKLQDYDMQQKMVKKLAKSCKIPYTISKIIEAVILNTSHYLKFNEYLDDCGTRCQDTNPLDKGLGCQMNVGNFNENGQKITFSQGENPYGVLVVRRFFKKDT